MPRTRVAAVPRGSKGVKIARLRLLGDMTDHPAPLEPQDALDELVDQLLNCGGVLSQIVGHMVRSQSSGFSAPDAAPIPEVAHHVIRDAVSETAAQYAEGELRSAARIVEEATNAICENVFLVPEPDAVWPPNGHAPGARLNRRARRQRRRGNGR